MTERILRLQENKLEDLHVMRSRGLFPVGLDVSGLLTAAQHGDRVITMHSRGSEVVSAIFIDKVIPDSESGREAGHIIYEYFRSILYEEKINVKTFMEYAKRNNYIDARLMVTEGTPTINGKVHHRLLGAQLPRLGEIPTTIELHQKTDWRHKIEMLHKLYDLSIVQIKLVDFTPANMQIAKRALGFRILNTTFTL